MRLHAPLLTELRAHDDATALAALVTALLGAAAVGGLVVAAPENLHAPYAALVAALSLGVVGLSAALGRAQSHLAREGRDQRAQHRQQLAALEADHAAALRRLAAEHESAREDDRARVSRDLHDALGQELAAVRYALSFTRQRYEVDRDGARANLAELDGLLAQVTATTQSILHDLRPRVVDDMGLATAAQWHCRAVADRAGLRVDVAVDGAEHAAAVPPERATAVFRVLQESLSNVTRHARATSVQVALTLDEAGALTLDVRDDGAGLDVDADAGDGLTSMRERAESLGGRLEVTSRPAVDGTQVRVTVPADSSLAPRADTGPAGAAAATPQKH